MKNKTVTYYFNKTITASMEEAEDKLVAELKKEGFGILTEIDVKKTLKKKLGVDFKKYKILGACNPEFAYQALQKEDKVGVFLPCNLVLEEAGQGKVEISAVDPVVNMQVIENPDLEPIGIEIRVKLQRVIENL